MAPPSESKYADDVHEPVPVSTHNTIAQGVAKDYAKRLKFYVNGRRFAVRDNPNKRLAGFLREHGYTGLQTGCGQGECGACTVVVTSTDANGEPVHRSINSCLATLGSVDGRDVTTIEGIGGKKKGYHAIQQRMAAANGTQCGFCTPGFVSQMYGLLLNDPSPSASKIEGNFAGNICRCTGYRSILSAMQSFAKDGEPNDRDKKLQSLGELDPEAGKKITSAELKGRPDLGLFSRAGYFRPRSLTDFWTILKELPDNQNVKYQVGNTASAIFWKYPPFHANDGAPLTVDISRLPELLESSVTDKGVSVGAAVTLINLTKIVQEAAGEGKSKVYEPLGEYLSHIGNNQVRNVASWAGNLVLVQNHPDFPSDIRTAFVTVGATLTLADANGTTQVTVDEFLKNGLKPRQIIVSVLLPFGKDNQRFGFYDVGARRSAIHSTVNAGFSLTLDEDGKVDDSYVTFGGIGPGQLHATGAEEALSGKPLISHTLKAALEATQEELKEAPKRHAKQEALHGRKYREDLALNLFYRFFLSQVEEVPNRLKSAVTPIERAVSSGSQAFDAAEEKMNSLHHAVQKIEALSQTAGELNYVSDIKGGGLHAAPVMTTQANGTITNVDPSVALDMPDVVSYIGADDVEAIGAKNECGAFPGDLPIFPKDEVLFKGQVIGLVVATSAPAARQAARKVKVTYKAADKNPILTIEDAIAANSFFDVRHPSQAMQPPDAYTRGDVEKGLAEAKHSLSGEVKVAGQEHFYMETQSVIVTPEDTKLKVQSATQDACGVRDRICNALNKKAGEVEVIAHRLGGSFGGKGSDSYYHATRAAVAAEVLQQPIRYRLNRAEDMQSTGFREAMIGKYKVGFDDDGRITAIDLYLVMDGGCSIDWSVFAVVVSTKDAENAYNIPNAKYHGKVCKQNLKSTQAMRAPTHAQSIYIMEAIIERVAENLKLDPADVRAKNFYKDGDTLCNPMPMPLQGVTMTKIWDALKERSKYDEKKKEIAEFNEKNKWKKRGISLVPVKYCLVQPQHKHKTDITVSDNDGTVIVSTTGVEMGQGLFTKVAQTVAHELGIPLEKVTVVLGSTHRHASSTVTGGSTTSEVCCMAAKKACEALKEQLKGAKEKVPDADWETLVKTAYQMGANLSANGWNAGGTVYFSWSAAAQVVELDVLTGETEILSCYMVYDCGTSLNPLIDIGQVEGAYVQGIGLFQSEEIVFSDDGSYVNANPWDYVLPNATSIPVEWKVDFLEETPFKQGFYGSKASGEPPLMLAMGVNFAIQHAAKAARAETGKEDSDTNHLAPMTYEKSSAACELTIDDLTLDD